MNTNQLNSVLSILAEDEVVPSSKNTGPRRSMSAASDSLKSSSSEKADGEPCRRRHRTEYVFDMSGMIPVEYVEIRDSGGEGCEVKDERQRCCNTAGKRSQEEEYRRPLKKRKGGNNKTSGGDEVSLVSAVDRNDSSSLSSCEGSSASGVLVRTEKVVSIKADTTDDDAPPRACELDGSSVGTGAKYKQGIRTLTTKKNGAAQARPKRCRRAPRSSPLKQQISLLLKDVNCLSEKSMELRKECDTLSQEILLLLTENESFRHTNQIISGFIAKLQLLHAANRRNVPTTTIRQQPNSLKEMMNTNSRELEALLLSLLSTYAIAQDRRRPELSWDCIIAIVQLLLSEQATASIG